MEGKFCRKGYVCQKKTEENNNWENLPKVEYLNFLANSDVNEAQLKELGLALRVKK